MLTLVCNDEALEPIIGIMKAILQVIQILIPIGLIIFGTIDLGKAVISSDEKKIQEGQKTLMKRAITAALVFLIATIVTFVMGFVGSDTWKGCWTSSSKCANPNSITGDCCDYVNASGEPVKSTATGAVAGKYDSASGLCVKK